MKKIISILVISVLFTSCASHSGRVCGGSGGKRCVDNVKIESLKPIKNSKRIS